MIRVADEAVCAARQALDAAFGAVRPLPESLPPIFVSVTETDEWLKGSQLWEALCFVPGCLSVYKNGDRSRVEKMATAHVMLHRCLQGDFQGEVYLALQRRYEQLRRYDLVLCNGRPSVPVAGLL